MLLNNMRKKLLGIFKRGSAFPFRTWSQKLIRQSLELLWKTAVQKSEHSTNSWTGLLWVTSASGHTMFLLKAPTCYLTTFWQFIQTDSRLQPLKGLLYIPQKDCWLLMLRAATEERCLGLSSAKRVPASVVFWTLSPQLPQASAWASRLSILLLGPRTLKDSQKCLIQGSLPKPKHEVIRWEKGRQKGWVKKSARSWSQIKRQN